MLIRKVPVSAVVFLLAVFSNSAFAQNKFYISGSLGNARSDVFLGALNRVDDNDSEYRLGAGFAFTRHFALEGTYTDFGSHNGETNCPPNYACLIIPVPTKAELSSLSIALVGTIPLSDRLGAYGKLGLSSWDIKYGGISAAFDASGEDLLYGVGLLGTINDHWKVFAEFEKVQLDVETTGVGVSYYF